MNNSNVAFQVNSKNIHDFSFGQVKNIVEEETRTKNIHEHSFEELKDAREKEARGSLCASC